MITSCPVQFGHFLFCLLVNSHTNLRGPEQEQLPYAALLAALNWFDAGADEVQLGGFAQIGSVAPDEWAAFVMGYCVPYSKEPQQSLARLVAEASGPLESDPLRESRGAIWESFDRLSMSDGRAGLLSVDSMQRLARVPTKLIEL